MDSPEAKEPSSNTTSEELTQRFSNFFNHIEPTSTSNHYEALSEYHTSAPRFHRRTGRRELSHEITKQVVSQRVDDKKYLSGPYRRAEWGEIVVEHVMEDKIINLKTAEVLESKPERYLIQFIDHGHFYPNNDETQELRVSSEVAFGYEFSPNPDSDEVTITANIGPVIHTGDRNYPYFVHLLELAEDILASNS